VRLEIRNEFAAVEVAVDASGNDPRLAIRDLETGERVCLDAFVLRSLALLPAAWLEALCRATVPADEAGPPAPPGGTIPAPHPTTPGRAERPEAEEDGWPGCSSP
jgi:hypothetical protein